MGKYLLNLLLVLSLLFFHLPLHAQIPGHWEKHVVCTKCSFIDYANLFPIAKLDFSDPNHGMIVGDDNDETDFALFDPGTQKTCRVYYTSDGGVTWSKHAAANLVLNDMQGFRFLTPNFAAGFNTVGTVYTTDQGSHWNVIWSRAPLQLFLSGKVFSQKTFYQVCNTQSRHSALVESSQDTGNSFQLLSAAKSTDKYLFFAGVMDDSLNIWALVRDSGTLNTSILRTTNGGLNWQESYPIDTTAGRFLIHSNSYFGNEDPNAFYLRNFTYVDKSHAEISLFDLLYTTDGGNNWEVDSSNHRRLAFATSSGKDRIWAFIGMRDFTNRYLCDTLAYSPNNGKTWYYDTESIRGDSVVSMMWKDSTHGYILSYKDSTITFAKYIPPSNDVIVTTMPYLAFNLTPTITTDIIHLTSYQAFNGTISFYDILGRLQMQSAMTFSNNEEKDLSLSGLSRGMYFVTYSSGGMSNFARIIKE